MRPNAREAIVNDNSVIQKKLADPFKPQQLGWKAQVTTQDKARCLAVPYIDARDVMGRLNEVLGIGGWQDEYEVLPGGSVVCTLTVHLDGRSVSRSDVGSPSEQPDAGDKLKAAFSDALKRAAVKFGVGRYLYYLDQFWVAYDAQRKQPDDKAALKMLPAWAMPAAEERKAAA
jgi:hypothetical protein